MPDVIAAASGGVLLLSLLAVALLVGAVAGPREPSAPALFLIGCIGLVGVCGLVYWFSSVA